MINNTVLFAFVVGALSVWVMLAARTWAKDLGLKMTWWKWSLAALWYLLLDFFVLASFTLIGEGEADASLKMLLFESILMIILGVGLLRILFAGRQKPSQKANG